MSFVITIFIILIPAASVAETGNDQCRAAYVSQIEIYWQIKLSRHCDGNDIANKRHDKSSMLQGQAAK